jgi:hypothetical protein
MKYLNQVLFVLVFLTLNSVKGQISSVTENYKGEERVIGKDASQIIEINAKIEVGLSKLEIRNVINEQYPLLSNQINLDEKIKGLKEALKNQTTILDILEKELPSLSDKQKYYRLTRTFLDKIIDDPELEARHDALFREFRENNPNNRDAKVRRAYIFENLNKDLESYSEQLKSMETLKYSVSLLAYKKDKTGGDRVHIQNFDTYANREFYTVERWVVDLSDEQKEELSEIASIAKKNNDKSLTIFQSLKEKFKLHFPSVDCLLAQKDNLLSFLSNADVVTKLNSAMKTDINVLVEQIEVITNQFKDFDFQVSSWDISSPFEIVERFNNALSAAGRIQIDFNNISNVLEAVNEIKGEVEELANGFKGCIDHLLTEVEDMRSIIDMIKKQQKNYIQNKTIGEEVISFSLDNLPEVGYIDLKGTGKRENGDELQLEVVLRVPSLKEGLPEQVILLEQRNLVMQLIGARSETAVGMILANPNKSSFDVGTDRKFFFAPSASLLLKFGSRKSYFYNEFIDFGIGLNFAAPDFNTDGTPEFGTGLIGTAFKNVLSIGYNYNVSLDTFYWFFGINLPFNLPGLPVNQVKN